MKNILLLLFMILVLATNEAKAKKILCHNNDSVKLCFLEYKVKYQKNCYKQKVKFSLDSQKDMKDFDQFDLSYEIKESKEVGGKNWFNLCFYPVNYFEMICRKKICGYSNIPSNR